MENFQIPWLTAITLLPLFACVAIPFIPDKEGKTVRWYALYVALADLALMVYVFWENYNVKSSEFQLVENFSWMPQLGLNWSLAVDGLSMPLIFLSGLITTLAIMASWKVNNKPKLYYFLVLALYLSLIHI